MEEKKAKFSDLGLSKWLIQNLSKVNIKNPTQIQKETIPLILKGNNIIGCAETGKGKTMSFCLPILQELAKDPYGIFGLIITPSRELALQISEQLEAVSGQINLKHLVIIGGVDQHYQTLQLENIPHIIIATPGRLFALMNQNTILAKYIKNLKFLVLDEADRLLEGNIQEDTKAIIEMLPESRQTLMFSATIKEAFREIGLEKISKDRKGSKSTKATENMRYFGLKEPMVVDTTVDSIAQTVEELTQSVKECYLIYLLRNVTGRSIIIFCSTCKRCHILQLLLEHLEMECSFIHSMIKQRQRMSNLQRFKSERSRILVCTDVASRGLDIPTVDIVINMDMPRSPVDYIHRVGRTGRGEGKAGLAISLITQYDIELLHAVEEYINLELTELEGITENDVLQDLSEVTKAMKVVNVHMSETGMADTFDKHYLLKKTIRKEKEKKAEKINGEKLKMNLKDNVRNKIIAGKVKEKKIKNKNKGKI